MDKVEQYLLATEAGARLYAKLGYRLMDTARLEGDAISPFGVTIHVMKYAPHSVLATRLKMSHETSASKVVELAADGISRNSGG